MAVDYSGKVRSAHDAIDLIQSGDVIVLPTGCAEPHATLTALSERRREFNDVEVSDVLPMHPFEYFDPETAHHVKHVGYFLGSPNRKLTQAGLLPVRANNFSEIPDLIRRGWYPCDVVIAQVSEPDENGDCALSLGCDYMQAAIEAARVVILEINPRMPWTYGDCHVNVERATAIVEDDSPLITAGLPEIGDVQKQIAGYVADLIPDGATLQIGYGAIPDAVVMQLTERRDLGIHTEMIGDGILTLIESGAVTHKHKNRHPGVSVATFALGSENLYRWMHRNKALEMHPVDVTNTPHIAGLNDNLHTINATIEIDLVGQACSESIAHRVHSGSGGQSDFVRAGNISKGGKSFIVTPSTAKGDTISRIVPTLNPGAHVTTSKNDINYVVTEYGVAQLRGKTNKQRAAELIAIAHPKFRDELGQKAQEMGLL